MYYQLVLRLRGDDCLDFETMVSLEDEIQQIIAPIAEVDGHDVGCEKMKIFILTRDPVASFERIKPLFSAEILLDKVGVAYRELRSDDFALLWPTSSIRAFVIA